MKRKYYVYIIQSSKDKVLYIGKTTNLKKRIFEHNSGLSKYTKSRMPWVLIWYCVFYNKAQADIFERYLKSGSGRAFIKRRLLNKSAEAI